MIAARRRSPACRVRARPALSVVWHFIPEGMLDDLRHHRPAFLRVFGGFTHKPEAWLLRLLVEQAETVAASFGVGHFFDAGYWTAFTRTARAGGCCTRIVHGGSLH